MAFIYVNSDARLPVPSDDEIARHTAKIHGTAPEVQPVQGVSDIKRPVRLAIASLGFADEETNRKVADLTLADLTNAKGLELVERQSLEKLLQEMNLSLSGLVRARDAVRVGKLLRADWFLLGSPVSLNGTNYLVVRVVDGHTGVLRDAGVFDIKPALTKVATNLAAFVRQCRQNAAEAKPRMYLAIGSFEDLSLNSRQAALPTQLRSYLTSAYQGANVTLLEREFANTLLQEVRLDLAGLTDEAGADAPVMQSAYWMVDGYYQSYETTEFEVELVLSVQRLFGQRQRLLLKEKPGELLFRRVKQTIDTAMLKDRAALTLTRVTELRVQLGVGRELIESVKSTPGFNPGMDWITFYTGTLGDSEVARLRRNTQEAILAFETALLLDPGNREAKSGLADCLKKGFMNRAEEARDLYRELIDAPVNDRWSSIAQKALLDSFRWVRPEEKRRWFETALTGSGNTAATEYFQAQVKAAIEEAILATPGTSEAERVAEERLLRDIRAWESQVRGRVFGVDFYNTGLGKYAEAFGTNAPLAARKMVALLPQLQATSTNLAPHIFAGVVTFQTDTNAAIIAEFERLLEAFPEQSLQYFEPRYFVQLLASPVYRWAEEHQLYALAAKTKEIHFQMAVRDRGLRVDAEDRMGLAFNYLRAEAWQKALEVFQSYSNQPVLMGNSGLWGKAFTTVLTSKKVAFCRQKLGLLPLIDPREFEMGDECLCLHEASAFTADADGLWIGIGGQLLHVTFDLKTNLSVVLPISGTVPITSLCLGSNSIWVGTAGEGLVEVEKDTRRGRRFTEKDGLMMDSVTALHLVNDILWIGYGHQAGGGLGKLDVASRRVTSFTASLSNESAATKPPRQRVTEIRGRPAGDLWYIARSTLSRYQPANNAWEEQPNKNGVFVPCFALDSERLIKALEIAQVELTIETKPSVKGATNQPPKITRVVSFEESARLQAILKTNRSGQRISGSTVGGSPPRGGLELHTLSDAHQQPLVEAEGLPSPPSTLMLQGRELWVGGQGFIALVDVDENRIKKLAYVPTRAVDQIQIGGGYVWAKYDKHLHRVSLSDVQ